MSTPLVSRDRAWRHGVRLASGPRADSPPSRRRGTAAMGARRAAVGPRAPLAPRCRSLPRLAFGSL